MLEELLCAERPLLRGRRPALLRPRRDQGPDRLPAGCSKIPPTRSRCGGSSTSRPGGSATPSSAGCRPTPGCSGDAVGGDRTGRGQRAGRGGHGSRLRRVPGSSRSSRLRARIWACPRFWKRRWPRAATWRCSKPTARSRPRGAWRTCRSWSASPWSMRSGGRRKPLATFLQEISLVSDQDALQEERRAVLLMTLHNAKGLDFQVAYLVGLEEGLFPHQRSLEEAGLAEERRLCYVGLTRARERLTLTYARARTISGGPLLQPALAVPERAAGADGSSGSDRPRRRGRHRDPAAAARATARPTGSRTVAPSTRGPDQPVPALSVGDEGAPRDAGRGHRHRP